MQMLPWNQGYFRSTSTKIGTCSPLRALKLEIPYCLNNPLHTLHLSSSECMFIIHPVQWPCWGLGEWRLLAGCCTSCLGLVLETAEEPVFDSHLTMLKPLGAVCQTSGYPRARSPQLPSASSWSGVSVSSVNSSLIKRLSSVSFFKVQPHHISQEFAC